MHIAKNLQASTVTKVLSKNLRNTTRLRKENFKAPFHLAKDKMKGRETATLKDGKIKHETLTNANKGYNKWLVWKHN